MGLTNSCKAIYHQLLLPLLALLLFFPTAGKSQEITLNLQNADIHALINTVAEVTGTNFVIDPRVTGKVTVISTQPMDHEALYDVFLSILDVHGFSAVGSGEVIKIVPNVNAKTSGIVAGLASTPVVGGDVVTEIIEVKHMPAQQLLPALRPLVPQYAHLAAFPNSNILLLSDHSYNVERIKALIAKIDIVTRMETEVIVLENASAAELAGVLTSLQSSSSSLQGVQFIADARSNSILLNGDQAGRVRLRGIIAHLDMPSGEQSNTHVVYLNYASAVDLVDILASTIDSDNDSNAPQTAVQADANTNSLIITASPPIYNGLRQVISKLDVRRAQVLVEAIIADVSAGNADELGVQWLVNGSGDGDGPVAGTVFGSGGSNIINIAQSALDGNAVLNPGLSLAVGHFDSDGTSFGALLRALATDVTANILSTPSIMTLDNQEAELLVGQSVPFVTGQFTNTGASSGSVNPFQTIEREDVGVTLKVTPQINDGNAIKLELHQEVSSLVPASTITGASDLVTNKRAISTTVLVDSGETIVLGGLIDDQVVTTDERVPLLGSLPVLGHFFRYQTSDHDKRKLMVFIKPEIVRDANDARNVTGSKYANMRASQLAQRLAAEAHLTTSDDAPVLPPLSWPEPATAPTTSPTPEQHP
ncbi:MAG: type II secretion system protein GspD [Immundisolibacteraceae bacterium]|nr:type II secretion system protein GspD [Immundisolibacteraceae bacterium]